MLPEARKYLWDALSAADNVLSLVAGLTFEAYMADARTRWAVERQLQIIGEALGQLRRKNPETAALIPELSTIVAFRNVLVHGYGEIDHMIVWGAIVADLKPLEVRLRKLLAT
jgi:uncharacterized protein with HEPN domain